MFTADKDKALLTTTTGALPRPSWYTENLLQIARPEEIAELIRRALKYIEPERLMPTSDCGLGAAVDELGRRKATSRRPIRISRWRRWRHEASRSCLQQDGEIP